ncbi:MAG TPA: hypothetical protein VLI92_00830 [Candidatus Saccharimonadales bacterium]|nr:hypothetical protein [Candidatus Saccharimonadales bacterium]
MAINTIVKESFESLETFIDTMEERPLNAVFRGYENHLSSQRDETQRETKFSGVNTYNDAMDILKKGYKEPLDKMKKAILKIGQQQSNQRPRMKNDFVGFVPNVPNTLMNLPMTMINREKIAPKTKTIHLTYSFCAAAKTSTNDMIKGGVNFISLVNSLEKQGYRVKIDLCFTGVANKTAAAFTVNLKQYGQQINLLKLAFPLVHPAMLRRLAFKWIETTPTLKEKDFLSGYGTPLNYFVGQSLEREREFIKEHGIIKGENSYYCNVYTALNAANIEQLAAAMQIIK